MTTLLQTPRTAHFPGMSQDLDHSYNDPSRATSASFQQQQPKDVGDSVYGAHYGEPASLAGRPTEAMFRFMAQDHVAPMETNSCPPDGPTYPAADFDGDLTSSSATMLGYPHPASSNGLRSDLADSTLSFPELPASLLDEAPEYEYSTHTRVNVFDAPQVFGDGFAETALGLGPDGTPLLGGNANDLALWSSSTDQSNEQAFQTDYLYQATAFDQPDEHGSLRAAGHPDTQIDGTLPGAADRSAEAQRRPPPPYAGPQSTPGGERPISEAHPAPGPASAANFPPSVLYQSSQTDEASRRGGPDGGEGVDARAGPSRTPNREGGDLPHGQAFPSSVGRPFPYHRASEDWSQSRRQSDEQIQGTRGPMVPSQVPGRGRLLSWQAGRSDFPPTDGEWQGGLPEQLAHGNALGYGPVTRNGSLSGPVDGVGPSSYGHASVSVNALGMPGPQDGHPSVVSAGIGAGPGPAGPFAMGARGPTPMGMHHVPPQPPPPPHAQHRHHPYGMPVHAGGGGVGGHYLGGHGIHGHPNEMINVLGDAMDASIDAEGIARCPYPNCNKTFAKNRSYNLKAHLRSHSQMKPFACAVCPRAFSRKHDLERHARVHSGDKPYICEICGKGFPRSDALRRHWRVEKECGEKAAQLEAGQPFAAVMGAGGGHFGHEQGDIPGPHHHFNNEHQAWLEAQRRRIG
ncbi:uncharacterized protein PSFLO_07443 [Pseudozyma flocculosa]|uniref:C2H2-type domain-containing protein n=1 Tax=Pseudozyma flocculosa TaxID=84751 RepID=A0A5C3FCG8_9BASI|nr:uncharacterized protein PSFLO_07443 [Pseudozyma flocculosa]